MLVTAWGEELAFNWQPLAKTESTSWSWLHPFRPMASVRPNPFTIGLEKLELTPKKEGLLNKLRAPEDAISQVIGRALSVSESHFEDSRKSMVRFNAKDKLKALDTPTLVIAGAADGLCEANLEDWQRLPNATLHVFSRVGHGIPREIPEEFSEVLKDFLEHGVVNAQTQEKKLRDNKKITFSEE